MTDPAEYAWAKYQRWHPSLDASPCETTDELTKDIAAWWASIALLAEEGHDAAIRTAVEDEAENWLRRMA